MRIEKLENEMDASLIGFDELTPPHRTDDEQATLCPGCPGVDECGECVKEEKDGENENKG